MKTCKHCSKELTHGRVYCDAQCMASDYGRNSRISQCTICGKNIKHPPSVQKKYCSQDCYHVSKRGKKRPEHSAKMKGRPGPKGRKFTTEQKEKISGENHWRWKGGYLSKEGYRVIRANGKKVFEHRYLMEQHIGRKLTEAEVVHHINHNRQDNRLSNLQVMTVAEHSALHEQDRKEGKNRVLCN